MQPTATSSSTASDPTSAALASTNPTAAPVAATPAPVTPSAAALAAPVPKYNYSNNVGSDQALQDLTNFQTSQKSPIDIYNEATKALGIPDVRTNVTNLRKQIADTTALLSALPDSVSGRTSGSLVTEAQRQRILATERAPLDQAAASYSTAYANESANLNDLTSQAQTQTNLVNEGQRNIESALTNRYNAIQTKEQQKRAQEEADRQFQLTVQQIQASQAQWEKQFAMSQKQFAESQRQFNVSQANAKSAANAPNVMQQASSDAARLLNGIMTRKAGYTEKSIIPTLQSQYPELTIDQIKNIVYSNRKSAYGF